MRSPRRHLEESSPKWCLHFLVAACTGRRKGKERTYVDFRRFVQLLNVVNYRLYVINERDSNRIYEVRIGDILSRGLKEEHKVMQHKTLEVVNAVELKVRSKKCRQEESLGDFVSRAGFEVNPDGSHAVFQEGAQETVWKLLGFWKAL